jgi:hypothetical protein
MEPVRIVCVSKAEDPKGSGHVHIVAAGVALDGGEKATGYITRGNILACLGRGQQFFTLAGEVKGEVRADGECGGRRHPVITTAKDASTANNLDDLPPCPEDLPLWNWAAP